MKRFLATIFTLTALISTDASAMGRRYSVGSILVSNVWARPSATENTAVYMDITYVNKDGGSDTLIDISTFASKKVELHQTIVDEKTGIAEMRSMKDLEISAEKPGKLAPRGDHIMLMGLKKVPLNEKEVIKLTLTFKKAGKVDVQAAVFSEANAMKEIAKNKAKTTTTKTAPEVAKIALPAIEPTTPSPTTPQAAS